MASGMRIIEEAKKPLSMNPKKFALWLFIASVTMLFAALTSAYLVRQSEGNWMMFDLPMLFWITSVIIVISSITMHWAYTAARHDNLIQLKWAMAITTLLGISFLIGQWMGYGELVSQHIYLTSVDASSVSASFVYLISGLHAAHIISGIIFLMVVWRSVVKLRVHSKSLAQIEMCMTYWHFLGGLWLYLFVFLLLNR